MWAYFHGHKSYNENGSGRVYPRHARTYHISNNADKGDMLKNNVEISSVAVTDKAFFISALIAVGWE